MKAKLFTKIQDLAVSKIDIVEKRLTIVLVNKKDYKMIDIVRAL